MSFLLYLLLFAFLAFIVFVLFRIVKKYRSRPPLLPTTGHRQYSNHTQSLSYGSPVEARSRIPHGILCSAPRSEPLAAPNVFPTIHLQQLPRQLPPPLSPLPVAARKPQQSSFSRDDLPVASIKQAHRPATKKKTTEWPLGPVYRPSLEPPSGSPKSQEHTFSRDSFPCPSVVHSYRPAVKSPVEVCIKPQPLESFESRDEATIIGEGGDEDDMNDLALRESAKQEYETMKKCQRGEKLAKRSRQFIRARELAIEAKRHRKRMQELNDQASELIFAKKNKDPTLRKIDLHGLTVKEAINHTKRILKQSRQLGNSEICLVVGKGNHSEGGQAKLKPAIQTFLKEHQFPAELDPKNHGVLVVRLDSASDF